MSLDSKTEVRIDKLAEGMDACRDDNEKNTISECPYPEGSVNAKNWWAGYHAFDELHE